jgi:hypothetical protein
MDATSRSREQGAGRREQGAGGRGQGAGSRGQGAGSREQGAGSREQGAGSREGTELVCRLCVPPMTAAMASMVVRTILLYGSCIKYSNQRNHESGLSHAGIRDNHLFVHFIVFFVPKCQSGLFMA